MTHSLLLIHKKKFAEISIWIILVATVCISYLGRYNRLGVDYSKLIVPNQDQKWTQGKKRVLVLDDDMSVYKNALLASPFLNWTLSKQIFNSSDYYENVITVHQGLINDPPDIIRDKNDLLRPFLERVPDLRQQYVRQDIYYIRKKSASK